MEARAGAGSSPLGAGDAGDMTVEERKTQYKALVLQCLAASKPDATLLIKLDNFLIRNVVFDKHPTSQTNLVRDIEFTREELTTLGARMGCCLLPMPEYGTDPADAAEDFTFEIESARVRLDTAVHLAVRRAIKAHGNPDVLVASLLLYHCLAQFYDVKEHLGFAEQTVEDLLKLYRPDYTEAPDFKAANFKKYRTAVIEAKALADRRAKLDAYNAAQAPLAAAAKQAVEAARLARIKADCDKHAAAFAAAKPHGGGDTSAVFGYVAKRGSGSATAPAPA